VSFAAGPESGLRILDTLGDDARLAPGTHIAAARADELRRAGRDAEAAVAYEQALMRAGTAPERAYLEGRLRELRRP
jgi:RNA polymerase sigma-70 factor (ECF subfamily)